MRRAESSPNSCCYSWCCCCCYYCCCYCLAKKRPRVKVPNKKKNESKETRNER